MNLLLIPLFAICNRCRGDKGWLPPIGKAGTMIALFYFLWPSWILGLLTAVLYLLGQSCGWGWWIGPIVGAAPSKKPVEGFRELISHIIAKKIFPNNSLWYCRIALVLIGLWWWLPVLICFRICWMTLVSLIICGVGFPLAFKIANRIPKINVPMLSGSWEKGEVIYGAFQGLAIHLLIN